MTDDQLEQRQEVKRTAMINYIISHPILRNNKTFRTYLLNREPDKAGGVIHAMKDYLSNLSPMMDLPVLHIYGKPGTGKSHLVTALVRFIVLNKWGVDDADLAPYAPVEYIDWPAFIGAKLNDAPAEVNWKAPLMVVEDVDKRHPIPKSGSTYWLDYLTDNLKPRIERLHLPTIFITHRSVREMETFLGTNQQGRIPNDQAKLLAEESAFLIGGNCIASGKTFSNDVRREIARSPKYINAIRLSAKNQLLPEWLQGEY